MTGTPAPVLQDVGANPATGGGQFSFSPGPSGHGILVYMAGTSAAQAWKINWLDNSGKMQPFITSTGAYTAPRLSPDGRKLVFLKDEDVFVADPERDALTRVTFTGGASPPIWAPDGKRPLLVSAGLVAGLLGSAATEREKPRRCWRAPPVQLPGPSLPTDGWPSSKGTLVRE